MARSNNLQTLETLNNGEELVFLYQLTEGHTSSSFACHIAAQVGLPQEVVQRGIQVGGLDFRLLMFIHAKAVTDLFKYFLGSLKIFEVVNKHTCDIPRLCRVLPLLIPLTRWSSRRAKSPAFSIFLSDFFADGPFFMSTVVYGITVGHIDL